MTDKEVKEVIEIMNDAENVDDLRINFINYEKHSQVGISIKEIIDILNYQQAKIEVLVEDTLCLRDTLKENESLRAEIERLSHKCDDCAGCTSWLCDCANERAEAIKEFAQHMKERFLKLEYRAKTPRKTIRIEELQEQMDWVLHSVSIETIDNLVKEMVGEQE